MLRRSTRLDRFLALGPVFVAGCFVASDGHGFVWYLGWFVMGLVIIGLIAETVAYAKSWRSSRRGIN